MCEFSLQICRIEKEKPFSLFCHLIIRTLVKSSDATKRAKTVINTAYGKAQSHQHRHGQCDSVSIKA